MKPHEFDEIRIKTNPIIPDDAWQEVLNRKMYNPKKITAQNSNKRAFSIQERLKQAFEYIDLCKINFEIIKFTAKVEKQVQELNAQCDAGKITYTAIYHKIKELRQQPMYSSIFDRYIDIIDLIEANWNKKLF